MRINRQIPLVNDSNKPTNNPSRQRNKTTDIPIFTDFDIASLFLKYKFVYLHYQV